MKGTLATPESADPYAALENILKTIKRFWLSEEGRLEDIRLLAQEAIEGRAGQPQEKPGSARPQRRRTGTKPSEARTADRSFDH